MTTSDTIWQQVEEDAFRQHLVALEERTNAVPVDVQVYDIAEEVRAAVCEGARLPLRIEKQFADDFACIAACQQGAQSVAAVLLEQWYRPHPKLAIRLAAADTIDLGVKEALDEICRTLMLAAVGEQHAAPNLPDAIFALIIKLHIPKLLGRLRSVKWQKPRYLAATHKKPLWCDFTNVIHRVQHLYPTRKEKPKRVAVERQLDDLRESYEQFEYSEDLDLEARLRTLVKATYIFCKDKLIREFASQLEVQRPTAQIAAALKCLRQLEKIAAYWRIARELITTAASFPHVFRNIELRCLPPHPSIPTTIAYEPWARTCHVHAEVQLVVDHDVRRHRRPEMRDEVFPSKVIGTSKYLCYLCYLFLTLHGHFLVSNTHGRLYDQWTVPDVAEYDQLRIRYAIILGDMDTRICEQTPGEPRWRAEPMTSRQNLLLL